MQWSHWSGHGPVAVQCNVPTDAQLTCGFQDPLCSHHSDLLIRVRACMQMDEINEDFPDVDVASVSYTHLTLPTIYSV